MRHKADGRASASAVDTVVFAAAASAAAAVHWAGVFLRGAWYVFSKDWRRCTTLSGFSFGLPISVRWQKKTENECRRGVDAGAPVLEFTGV